MAAMNDPVTLSRALASATALLAGAGLESPRREALALAGALLGLARERMVAEPDQVLDGDALRRFEDGVRRRAAREPFARIVGRREFWSLDFTLAPDTLVPRPETETLVEVVLDTVADRGAAMTLLDLGTGSGCILLALLSELPNARGIGIDRSEGAVSAARANAVRLGLEARATFRTGDWGRGSVGPFDVIVSNPPYIAEAARGALEREVRDFDPPLALFAGADGFDAFRVIVPQLSGLLAWGGLAAFECGAGQAEKLAEMLVFSGLDDISARADLAGHARVVSGRREGFNRALRVVKKTVGKGDVPV